MLVGVLEFVVILILNMLLTFIVLSQDYYLVAIKSAYEKTIIAITSILIRLLLSTWIVYSTTATLLGTLQAVVIQSIILLFLWVLSKYVQKYKESWFITTIAFIAYGIGFYFYIMFAKELL
uniref:hypothetical protein n=1 Tax=Bacillus cytotoxicus TaxID=580165 RepID=UPI00333F0851